MSNNPQPMTQAEMDALLKQVSQADSNVDTLTGCKLGRCFTKDFEAMIANADKEYADITLAMLDLDNFMRINDTFGHSVGDEVFVEVGKILLAIDAEKSVYRSGDEFSIIFTNMEKERAFLIMEKIRGDISKAEVCVKTSATVSIGIATYPEDGSKQAELVRKADGALYRAKSSGRNKVCLAREEKLVAKTTHYTVEQLKRLKELSESQSTVEAVLMREALDDLLKKYNSKKSLERGTVVLVDDAGFMRMMQKDILSKNGYTVVGEASDGIEGLEVINKTNPDFVLLDITMPNMDGLAMLKELRKTINPKTRVIMVSAMGQPSYIIDSYVSGADAFIVKPFSADRLVNTISNIDAYTVPEECIDKFTEIVQSYGVDKLSQQQIDGAREESMKNKKEKKNK